MPAKYEYVLYEGRNDPATAVCSFENDEPPVKDIDLHMENPEGKPVTYRIMEFWRTNVRNEAPVRFTVLVKKI